MSMYYLTIGGFDVTEPNDERAGGTRRKFNLMASLCRLLLQLGLYLDDLLMVAAGVCFVASAALTFGLGAALATAGCCLTAYSVVVARSRGGDGGK